MIGVVCMMHEGKELEGYWQMLRSVQAVFGEVESFVGLNGHGVPPEGCQWARHDWVDFATNRNLALEDARRMLDSEWLLLLDPDMVLGGSYDGNLEGNGYMIENRLNDIVYHLPLLVRKAHPWRYSGPVHETLVEGAGLPLLPGVHVRNNGTISRDRFTRDAALLEKTVAANPTDTRSWFYLGNSYRDMHTDESRAKAIDAYQKRIDLGGIHVEETYIALLERGKLLADWSALLRAWEYRPWRGEALYNALGLLRADRLYNAAYALATHGVEHCEPRQDFLFVEPGVYDWGLKFELSIAAWWTGAQQEAMALSDSLDRDGVPDHVRAQARRNRNLELVA